MSATRRLPIDGMRRAASRTTSPQRGWSRECPRRPVLSHDLAHSPTPRPKRGRSTAEPAHLGEDRHEAVHRGEGYLVPEALRRALTGDDVKGPVAAAKVCLERGIGVPTKPRQDGNPTRPLRGPELRALRRLQRGLPASALRLHHRAPRAPRAAHRLRGAEDPRQSRRGGQGS
jgi:hypothetical protein